MRQKLLATICILVATCGASVPSIPDILQTNQYLLIAQQDQATSIETDVVPGRCPHFMMKPLNKQRQSISDSQIIGVHLVRDPLGRSAPLLMTLHLKYATSNYQVNYQVLMQTFNLNATDVFQTKIERGVRFNEQSEGSVQYVTSKRFKTSLFDSTNHMLFFEESSSLGFSLHQFYVLDLFTKNPRLRKVGEFSQKSLSSRYDWQEDQYAGKFYYKEKIDNEISIFEIPMGALIPTAFEGDAGTRIGQINQNVTLYGASGGAFYHANMIQRGNGTVMISSLVPVSLQTGIRCESKIKLSNVPVFNKLIIIRDQDFCMLRDGANYSREACYQEQRTYLGLGAEGEETDYVKWLLVTCIVMFMVIVLLFVYIYWLRSTFVSDYDRTHPQEYENEASLFVSKQRSFPSVYQDPALLDVSVDRWN